MSDRRRDAATATVGAGLTAGGGYLRHQAVQPLIAANKKAGKKDPRFHGLAVARSGNKALRVKYGRGAALGLVGAVPLAIGTTRFVRGDVHKQEPKKKSFLVEGLGGTKDALIERTETATARDVPAKARTAGLATSVAAAGLGGIGARALLRKKPAGAKALISPVAGVLTGAAATPLSSRVVDRVSPGYEVTPAGVKRKKKGLKRPSSSSYSSQMVPRSFTADIAKNDNAYRAKVSAAAAIPVAGYGLQAIAARQGFKNDKDRNRASLTQGGAAMAGDAVGFTAGSYGAAALAARNKKFAAGAERAAEGLDNAKSRIRSTLGLKPKQPKPLKPAGASNTIRGKLVRAATKPLRGKYGVAAGVGGVGGMFVAGNTAQQTAISHNLRRQKVAKSVVPGMTQRDRQKQARKKRFQAVLNYGGGAAGLTGMALLGAAKTPGAAARLKKTPEQLKSMSNTATTIGAGIGGIGALNYAGVLRREAQAERKISKSIVRLADGNRAYKPITQMTAYERSRIKATAQGARNSKYRRGDAQGGGGRKIWDEKLPKQGKLEVRRGQVSFATPYAGRARPDGRGGGIMDLNAKGENVRRHEMAHMTPRRNPHTFQRRYQDPYRRGREEARADVAGGFKTNYPDHHPEFQRGYHEVRGKLRSPVKDRNNYHAYDARSGQMTGSKGNPDRRGFNPFRDSRGQRAVLGGTFVASTGAGYGASAWGQKRKDEQARRNKIKKSMPDQAVLHVPRGLLKQKTYASSGMRRLNNGTLVRTKAGVR